MTATTALEEAHELMNAKDWEGAIRLLEACDAEAKTAFEISWNLGWAYFQNEAFESAVKWLTIASEAKPGDGPTRWALGVALMDDERDEEAEHQLLLSLALKDSYLARSALGLLLHRQGRLEEAEAIYLQSIKLKPNDGRRLGAYADFLSDVGRESEAADYYRRAARAPRPDDNSAES